MAELGFGTFADKKRGPSCSEADIGIQQEKTLKVWGQTEKGVSKRSKKGGGKTFHKKGHFREEKKNQDHRPTGQSLGKNVKKAGKQ